MVYIDWKRIMAITPDNMTEQEKDELFESVAWCSPEYNTERQKLHHFVRVLQETLKYKAELVESLMNELDELAARQGEEEALKRQDLLDEIEELKEQLKYQEKLDSKNGAVLSQEEMKREIIKLEMQNEELVVELQDKEKDLINEKLEAEKLVSQVAVLEREKLELTRELTALQDETNERLNAKTSRESPEFDAEKMEELTEIIRQKNKHISQLLEDVETVEQENLKLRTKLTNVRDELRESTTHITDMTSEISKLNHLLRDSEEKYEALEQQNQGLVSQIEDLINERSNNDKELDKFAEHLNSKVEEWKNLLDYKDGEISKLKDDLKKLMSSSHIPITEDLSDDVLQQKIRKQEEEIILLQNDLVSATQELEKSAEIIEKFKEKQIGFKHCLGALPESEQKAVEEKITFLEEKLKYAEEDAQTKAEEMSELVIKIKEFEAGEYGLTEAHMKMKKLSKTIDLKNKQIEKLIENSNETQIQLENLAEQNMILREKLGIPADETIDTSQVQTKSRKDQELIENLKTQLENREEEVIKLKLQQRKLLKVLKKTKRWVLDSGESEEQSSTANETNLGKNIHKEMLDKQKEEISELNQKFEHIVTENEALRKGMHEILESIQSQDGNASVEVQSQTLERLLEALDSRHISGWYHPAMRLQTQLSNTEGKMQELRNQIRVQRLANSEVNCDLQEAIAKIQEMERIIVLQQAELDNDQRSKETDAEELSPSPKADILTSIEQEQKIVHLEIELQEMKLAFDKIKKELEVQDMRKESETKIMQDVGDDETSSLLKKLQMAQNIEAELWNKYRLISIEFLEMEEELTQKFVQVSKDKSILLIRIGKLEKENMNSVSRDKFDEISKELEEVQAKYHRTVSISLMAYQDPVVENLQKEISIYEEEKQQILDELRIVKEKVIGESLITEETSGNEVSILTTKLATSEVRELNEKQKSAHLEKINLMIKSDQQELEEHNKELMKCVNNLTEEKLELEAKGREMQNNLLIYHSLEEYSQLTEKVEQLGEMVKELTIEKDNLQELLDISQGQCRALQNVKEMNKFHSTITNLVTVSNDDKATIARLSHELIISQTTSSELNNKNSDLQIKFSKMSALNICLQTKVDELNDNLIIEQSKHVSEVQYLRSILLEIRKNYSGVTTFPAMENFYLLKLSVRQEQNEIYEKMKDLKRSIEEYLAKREELEIQMESLQELKAALRSNDQSKILVAWHNKATELKLKEAKSRRQKEFLAREVIQLEDCVKRLYEEISLLEEKGLEKERDWEKRYFALDVSIQNEPASPQTTSKQTQTEQVRQTEDHSSVQVISEQIHAISRNEQYITELLFENSNMKKIIEEKDSIISTKEAILGSLSTQRNKQLEESVTRDKSDETEKMALRVTIENLQKVLAQKEETIFRFQNVLKAGRDEFSKTSTKLQEELRSVHEALANQNKAYNRLKYSSTSQVSRDISSVVVEKYISKIHDLEDELSDVQSSILDMKAQVQSSEQEADRWKSLADDRLKLTEDLRQRLEVQFKQEIGYKEEIQHYQLELEQLKLVSSGRNMRDTEKQKEKLKQMQLQLMEQESKTAQIPAETSDEKDSKFAIELESVRRQLKSSKDETTRLREQLKLLQIQKPKRTGSSSTLDSKTSAKEASLKEKLKSLEDLLKLSKEREIELLESEQKKLKSKEEVTRWEERKRAQQTLDKLNTKVKEKDIEVEVLKNKNESLRNLIQKCEKEKHLLEAQLKNAKGTLRFEKLMIENEKLKAQVEAQNIELEERLRHSGGLGAALLHEKLEEQERKLAVLELATQGSPMIEEVQRLKSINNTLEKENLKLETENFSLKLKLEKCTGSLRQAQERVKHADAYREQSECSNKNDPALELLQQSIDQLTEENTRLRSSQGRSPKLITSTERLRRDLYKAKDDLRDLQDKYVVTMQRNAVLEEELKKCRYQIRLLEEKDIVDSISKTNNLELASEMSQELAFIKGQLAHKSQLLDKVKVLLKKAAAKEKSLNDKVLALQSMIPQTIQT